MSGDFDSNTPTETEYAGVRPLPNTVSPKDPDLLKPHERLVLGHLTGQETDTEAERKSGFFYGVDLDYPDNPKL